MPPLIVDAHQDLAYNALTFGRDYTQSAHDTRRREAASNSPAPARNGNALIGLPDLLRGEVAVVFGTLFAAPVRRRTGEWDTLAYANANEAHTLYARQLDYYNKLADEHPQFVLIESRRDLNSVLSSWNGGDPSARRVGLVRLMEGADCIREPQEAEWWMERGVRVVGLAWSGTRYAGGTREPGPLTPDGRRLLLVMSNLGLILDLSHASDESFLEALDRFDGAVIASHANARALTPLLPTPERSLSDDMIRRLAARDGVIGVVPYNRFLTGAWVATDGKNAVTLAHVTAMIDHICQVTGRVDHVAIGSDFDGGFGVEHVPAEIDTVADLALIGTALAGRGYAVTEVEKVMSGNWIRLLRKGLPA